MQDGVPILLSASAAGAMTSANYSSGWIPAQGAGSMSVQLTNVGVGCTFTYEGSNDGVTAYALPGYSQTAGGTLVSAASDTTANLRAFNVETAFVRVRVSTYGSGTPTAALVLKTGDQPAFSSLVAQGAVGATPWLFQQKPTTTGGCIISKMVSAATTNAALIKATATQVYGFCYSNTHATLWRFVKIFNKATAPVPGTDVPIFTIAIPPMQNVNFPLDLGIVCTAGVGIAVTGAYADLDTTAVGAGDVVGFLELI